MKNNKIIKHKTVVLREDPRAYKIKIYKHLASLHNWELEYKAIPRREFRCDMADPRLKIAVEYEGISRIAKGGGHANKQGLLKDIEKYNLLASNGWVLLRFSYKDSMKLTKVTKTVNDVIKIREAQLYGIKDKPNIQMSDL